MRRVVVTGLGAISPLGHDVASYVAGLNEGQSAIGAPTIRGAEKLSTKAVAEVKDFDPARHFSDRQLSTLDRVSQFAVFSGREAVAQSGLSFDGALGERTAAIIGTGGGGVNTHEESLYRVFVEGATRVHPLTIPKAMVNAAASQVSMHFALRGPSFAVASACASATHAIGLAFHMVRSGTVDCAVTGGTDACLTFGSVRGWEAMRVMAPDTCRPFSRERKGMVLGEGAALFVLEPLEDARARGAEILGEIVGFGMSADARDITAPDAGGMSRAIVGAMRDAQLNAEDVDYVNAHGTGTLANDATETAALKLSFGEHAYKLAVSSTKSMIGHPLGSAGALELVAALSAVQGGVVPPTIGYLAADPDCDLDYVPNEARRMPVEVALSNSFAFGGLNAVLAVRRFA